MEDNKSSNTISRTVIILIIAIIISSIVLGFLLFNQYNGDTENNNLNDVVIEPTTENVPTAPETFDFRDLPVPDIIITQEQLSQNSSIESCWTIIDEVVYDISRALITEPEIFQGNIENICGKDSTSTLGVANGDIPPLGRFRGRSDTYYIPMGRISL